MCASVGEEIQNGLCSRSFISSAFGLNEVIAIPSRR